jgi:hypothetical protein
LTVATNITSMKSTISVYLFIKNCNLLAHHYAD